MFSNFFIMTGIQKGNKSDFFPGQFQCYNQGFVTPYLFLPKISISQQPEANHNSGRSDLGETTIPLLEIIMALESFAKMLRENSSNLYY